MSTLSELEAAAAVVYDAVQGYTSVDELHPGQGAWVLRATPGLDGL